MKSFVIDFTDAAEPPRDGAILFNGVAFTTPPLFQLDETKPQDLQTRNGRPPMGEWVSISGKPGSGYTVETDFFGFYPVFYTAPELNPKGITAVGNRFDALAAHLANQGISSQIDVDEASAKLASRHSFYNQAYTTRTSSRHIRRLGADERLKIQGNRVVVEKTTLFSGPDDYDALLQQGIESFATALKSQLQSLPQELVCLYLSGGKDSRACLSLLLASGLAPGKIHCNPRLAAEGTSDFAKEVFAQDLRISSHMIERWGLGLFSPDPKAPIPIFFRDSLHAWGARGLNAYYLFNPAYFTYNQQQPHQIDIRGGCGEVLRGFWAEALLKTACAERIRNTPSSITQDARTFFKATTNASAGLAPDAEERFVNEFASIPGEAFYERIDNHYILHRNRYHFGHVRESARSGIALLFPLGTPEFHWAAQSISYEKRRQGTVIFDIIEATVAELNDIEFQSGPWPEELTAKHQRPLAPPPSAANLDALHAHKEAATLKAREAFKPHAGHRYNIPNELKERLKENLACLQDAGVFKPQLIDFIKTNAERDLASLKLAVTKTETVAIVLRQSDGHAFELVSVPKRP